ncbi:MAG: hypothetical protein KF756_13215 [Acidobacteria bacterium]|nr:hypothetical protein [Acidobacteriota bacterium]
MTKKLFILIAILCFSATAFADVKITTRQTMSGQSSQNTTYIKGKRSRTEMMNGMMITLTQCDLRRDVQMNPAAETYMVTYYEDGSSSTQVSKPGEPAPVKKGGTMYVTTTIKDTGERKQMFGYNARHIIQTVVMESSPDACNPTKTKMEMDMWVIDAEFALQCSQDRQYVPRVAGLNSGCTDKVVPKTIGTAKSGYPVWQKMTSFDQSGKETFSTISEVIELSKATLDPALFEVPKDYREVKNAADMYSASNSSSSYSSGSMSSSTYSTPDSSSSLNSSIQQANSASVVSATDLGPKKEGTVRIGLAGVKTGTVSSGIAANDLALAIANTLGTYLKGTKVELVILEAKLASAATAEAREKQCDLVLNATVSHKKGGGGFGGFGKMLGSVVSQTGIGHTGSVAGNIAGQMATTTIVSAANLSGDVKSKDELTLDVQLLSLADNSSKLAKTFKVKAKSDGDDIISAIVEQAAQAIVNAVGA